jgi:hypothetical protein
MSDEMLSAVTKIVFEAIELLIKEGTQEPIDLAAIGNAMKHVDPTFTPQKYGFEKLRPLMEKVPGLTIIKDDSIFPSRYFATKSSKDQLARISPPSVDTPTDRRQVAGDRIIDFAFVPPNNYRILEGMALPERWSYDSTKDGGDLSFLKNYLNFTYVRLKFEKKILLSADKENAAFNTGLVDTRYEPIYAFFSINTNKGRQEWRLDGFCIAGEDYLGKKLHSQFKPLPEPAYYFNNPSDAIYDVTQGAPIVDWKHIIEEHPDRIPPALLKRYPVRGFDVKSTASMNGVEYDAYIKDFATAIENDKSTYRRIKSEFNSALDLAVKKVRWNYKTAIPVYFPRANKMSLLLPLAIVSDDVVDVALVVERTKSGSYQGHTTYSLDWAYRNARLICRPDSDWLSADIIDPSEDLIAHGGDDDL